MTASEHDDDDPLADVPRPAPIALDDALSLAEFLHRRCGVAAAAIQLGRFEVVRKIGAGAHGSVYVGRDPLLNRDVALKVRNDRGAPRREQLRFAREARALAALSHPNVVQVFAHGSSQFGSWIAMELISGESLAAWQRARRDWKEIVAAYLQAGDGLAAAHAVGIVHRDLKPNNLLVGADGRVRVADFGLADGPFAQMHHEGTAPSLGVSGEMTTAAESTERVGGGTPGYAAPEQMLDGRADARSDQFAFCVSMFESLYGARPYTVQQIAQLGIDPSRTRDVAPRPKRIPRHVVQVLRRGLSADPRSRFRDMNELLSSLRRSPRRNTIGVALFLCVAALASASATASSSAACEAVAMELDDAWGPQQRALVEQRFSEDGSAAATSMWSHVSSELDGYAAEWIAARESVCARSGSTSDVPALDAEAACLSRRRTQLESVSAALLDGDDISRLHGDEILAQLHAIDECPGVLSVVRLAAPSRAQVGSVAAVLVDVDRARVLSASGRYREALEIAEQAGILAVASDHAPTIAEAELARGHALDELGRDHEAAVAFEYAATLAESSRHDQLAPRAWHSLVRVAAVDLEDQVLAHAAAAHARAAMARIEADPVLLADDAFAAASVAGDDVEADVLLVHALTLLCSVLEPGDPRLATALSEIANRRARMGRISEADALYREAMAIRTARLGPDHPSVATLEFNLGVNARDDGEFERAMDHFERALAIQERAYGASSARIAPALLMIAEMRMRGRDLEGAVKAADRAWSIQRILPQGHSDRGSALTLLTVIHLERNDEEAALETSLAWSAELPADAPAQDKNEATNAIAWILCELDRCTEARPYYTRLLEQVHGDRALAWAEAGLGRVELASGNAREAERLLQSARTRAQRLEQPDPELLAEIDADTARALRMLGEAERARTLARSAAARERHIATASRSALDATGVFADP